MPDNDTTIDCDSDVGITMGLVDSIITQIKCLRNREFENRAVQEALQDMWFHIHHFLPLPLIEDEYR